MPREYPPETYEPQQVNEIPEYPVEPDFRNLTPQEKSDLINEFVTDLLILYLPKQVRNINQIAQIKHQIVNAMMDVLNRSSTDGILRVGEPDELSRNIVKVLGINRDPTKTKEQKRHADLDILGQVYHFYLDLGLVDEEFLLESEWAEDEGEEY